MTPYELYYLLDINKLEEKKRWKDDNVENWINKIEKNHEKYFTWLSLELKRHKNF